MKLFKSKIVESFYSIFPITLIVLILSLTLAPIDTTTLLKLVVGAFCLIFGIALFTLGAEGSMSPMGAQMGSGLSQKNKIWLTLVTALVIGLLITLAEPDLAILSGQVNGLNPWVFRIVVAVGIGVFLLLGILRTLFKIKTNIIFTIGYAIIFILVIFAPQKLWALSFDSSAVTTGAISVPFLLAFGMGITAVRSQGQENDSFGLMGICSVGPVITVLVLSLFINVDKLTLAASAEVGTTGVMADLGHLIPEFLEEMAISILPIVAIYMLFQVVMLKLPWFKVAKVGMNLIYTYVGIVIFLVGVNLGYLPLATVLGESLAENHQLLLMPIGLILGYFIISAEPAVHVLKKQVEEITGGAIKQRVIVFAMSIGVALSVGLAVLRSMYNVNILYFIIPAYAISIGLSYFNPQIFTSIAFDSGGVATGAMAVSFILPFMKGISSSFDNSFGTLALMAAFPILAVQILGCIYKIAMKKAERKRRLRENMRVRIIEFD